MAECDPQELMSEAACFACLSPSDKATLALQLLCEIANAAPPVGGVTSIIAGAGISVDQATGDVTVTNTGLQDPEPLWVPAARWAPAATNGPLANSRDAGGIRVLDSWDFIPAATRTATVEIGVPASWTGTTIAIRFQWSTASGTAAQFVRLTCAARYLTDGDLETVAFGTAQQVDDAIGAVDTFRDTDATPAITPGGVKSRVLSLQFQRLGASDDAPGNCRALGVYIDWL